MGNQQGTTKGKGHNNATTQRGRSLSSAFGDRLQIPQLDLPQATLSTTMSDLSETEPENDFDLNYEDLVVRSKINLFGRDDLFSGTWSNREVCVKKFVDLAKFQNEYAIVSNIEAHPNVVNFHGACTAPGSTSAHPAIHYIVSEYISTSLYEVLYKSDESQQPTWRDKVQICLEVARGIRHLHSNRVSLGSSMKCDSIAIDRESRKVKIFDFSDAVHVSMTPAQQQHQNQDVPKEVEANDVMLFGARILYDVFVGSPGTEGTIQMFHRKFNENSSYRPSPSELAARMAAVAAQHSQSADSNDTQNALQTTTRQFLQLLQDCWDSNIDNRPTFNEIILLLNDLLKQLDNPAYISRCDRIRRRGYKSLLAIPDKVIGRDIDLEIVKDRMRAGLSLNPDMEGAVRMTNSAMRCLLVTGSAGMGKTLFVRKLMRDIQNIVGDEKGDWYNYIEAKFVQGSRTPYQTLAAAIQPLIAKKIIEPSLKSKKALKNWKSMISKAVGVTHLPVLLQMFPELESILASKVDKRATTSLGSSSGSYTGSYTARMLFLEETNSKMVECLERFFALLSAAKQFITLFVDDAQWADAASLKILEALSSNVNISIIIAYHDNELTEASPLPKTIEALQRNMKSHTVSLLPLSIQDINKVCSAALLTNDSVTMPLTEVIYRKTGGNPYHFVQYLQALYQEELIRYSYDEERWVWDIKSVSEFGQTLSDNMIDLLVMKIKQLSRKSQNILKLASCLGFSFPLEELRILCQDFVFEEKDMRSCIGDINERDLEECVLNNYLIPKAKGSSSTDNLTSDVVSSAFGAVYSFSHSRIQKACNSLWRDWPKSSEKIHLKIGNALKRSAAKKGDLQLSSSNALFFDIVYHMNIGRNLLSKDEVKLRELVILNLQASLKAQKAGDNPRAVEFVRIANDLLFQKISVLIAPSQPHAVSSSVTQNNQAMAVWSNEKYYHIAVQCCLLAEQLEYANMNYDRGDAKLVEIRRYSQSDHYITEAFLIKVIQLEFESKFSDILALAKEYIDVVVSEKRGSKLNFVDASAEDAKSAYLAVKKFLEADNFASIQKLQIAKPVMSNQTITFSHWNLYNSAVRPATSGVATDVPSTKLPAPAKPGFVTTDERLEILTFFIAIGTAVVQHCAVEKTVFFFARLIELALKLSKSRQHLLLSPHILWGFAMFSWLISNLYGDFDFAKSLAAAAMSHPDAKNSSIFNLAYDSYIREWEQPKKDISRHLLRNVVSLCLEQGNWTAAGYATSNAVWHHVLSSGKPVYSVIKKLNKLGNMFAEKNQSFPVLNIKAGLYLRLLSAKGGFKERDFVDLENELEAFPSSQPRMVYYLTKALTLSLLSDHHAIVAASNHKFEEANSEIDRQKCIEGYEQIINTLKLSLQNASFNVKDVLLSVARDCLHVITYYRWESLQSQSVLSTKNVQKQKRDIQEMLEGLETVNNTLCRDNFGHFYSLALAEKYRQGILTNILGLKQQTETKPLSGSPTSPSAYSMSRHEKRVTECLKYYNDAIVDARNSGATLFEVLAMNLMFTFCHDIGKAEQANKAYVDLYLRCRRLGLSTKLQLMEIRYPNYFEHLQNDAEYIRATRGAVDIDKSQLHKTFLELCSQGDLDMILALMCYNYEELSASSNITFSMSSASSNTLSDAATDDDTSSATTAMDQPASRRSTNLAGILAAVSAATSNMSTKGKNLKSAQFYEILHNLSSDKSDNTLSAGLRRAAANGHHKLVKFLVSKCGANIKDVDSFKSNALHYAAAGGHAQVLSVMLQHLSTSVLASDELFSILNARDIYGKVPLHLCLKKETNLEAAKILLMYSADLNVKQSNGDTSLHEVYSAGNLNVVMFLLRYKDQLKFNAKDRDGNTPLIRAAMNNKLDVVKATLQYFMYVMSQSVDSTTLPPRTTNQLARTIAADLTPANDIESLLITSIDRRGYTIFHLAAETNNTRFIQICEELLLQVLTPGTEKMFGSNAQELGEAGVRAFRNSLTKMLFIREYNASATPIEIALARKNYRIAGLLVAYLQDRELQVMISDEIAVGATSLAGLLNEHPLFASLASPAIAANGVAALADRGTAGSAATAAAVVPASSIVPGAIRGGISGLSGFSVGDNTLQISGGNQPRNAHGQPITMF